MQRENEGIWWANEETRNRYERMQWVNEGMWRQMKGCDEYIKGYEDQMKRYNEQGYARMRG
jgi:hypothetical protein